VRDVGQVVRRFGPVIAVVALLGLILVVAGMSGPEVTGVPLPGGTAREAEPPPPPPTALPAPMPSPTIAPPQSLDVPGWLAVVPVVGAVVLLAGLVVLVAWLVRLWLRHRKPRQVLAVETSELPEPEEAAAPIRAAVEAGIEELDDDSVDPRRAVIACWLRLEAAAAAAGTPREVADTPADLVARMLAAHQVSPSVLRRCAELYRQARYAPAEVEESMRTHARAALEQLRAELAAAAAAGKEPAPATESMAVTEPPVTAGEDARR
jgi:hypothetical protein